MRTQYFTSLYRRDTSTVTHIFLLKKHTFPKLKFVKIYLIKSLKSVFFIE